MGSGSSLSSLSDDDILLLSEKYAELHAAGMDGVALLHRLNAAAIEINERKRTAVISDKTEGSKKEDHVEKVRKLLLKIVLEESFSNFFVGVDGSENSDLAFQVATQELMKSKDGVVLIHAFDSTVKRPDLPTALMPKELHERLHCMLVSTMSAKRFRMKWLDKAGSTTKNFIVKTINDLLHDREKLPLIERPSYIVTGITGRKGNLKGKTLPIVAAGHFHIPNIVVKCPPITNRARVFFAAIKDFEHLSPYYVALDLMKPGHGDKVRDLFTL